MAQVINEANTGLAASINGENALSRPSYQAYLRVRTNKNAR